MRRAVNLTFILQKKERGLLPLLFLLLGFTGGLVLGGLFRAGGGLFGLLSLLAVVGVNFRLHEFIGGHVFPFFRDNYGDTGIAANTVVISDNATILTVVNLVETIDVGDVKSVENGGTDVGIDNGLTYFKHCITFLVFKSFVLFSIFIIL